MAAAATTMAENSSDGPVLNLMSKRLRALRKKYNRITQMEEALAQGKTLNPEQEEVLRSKPAVVVLIDEYEKLRAPLSLAVQEELSHLSPSSPSPYGDLAVEDLVGLVYFGRLFDVQPQTDFTATMLTRTHERSCCLTYDYVTDDAVELLGERDLDEISSLGALVTSRPVSSGVSHKNALQGCVNHARLWLERSDQTIHSGTSVTYAVLREKLKKIMASDYYTTTPEMKAADDVAAAGGKYNKACQVQVPESVAASEVEIDDSPVPYQYKTRKHGYSIEGAVPIYPSETEDDQQNSPKSDLAPDQSSLVDESLKVESDVLNPSMDTISDQQEQQKPDESDEQNVIEADQREHQYIPRRAYPNQRGGNRGVGGFGGGRRGYPGSRGRGVPRGGGGIYQNGRSQYYDPRNYYNPRGRGGGRSGGLAMPNNHGVPTHLSQASNGSD